MALSQPQREKLVEELQRAYYAGRTRNEAFAFFHEEQPRTKSITRGKKLTAAALMPLLSPESLKKLTAWPHLPDLRDKITAQDRPAVGQWIQLLVVGEYVTQDEATAAMAKVAETETVDVPDGCDSARFFTVFSGDGPAEGEDPELFVGVPNLIPGEDFDAAWAAAGRS